MSSRSMKASSAEVVPGARVTVLNGRHFPAFRAGDEGLVLSIDEEAQTCQVEFSGRPRNQPVQVALRHLQVQGATTATAAAAAAAAATAAPGTKGTAPQPDAVSGAGGARRARMEPPETTIYGDDPNSLPPRGRPVPSGGASSAASSSTRPARQNEPEQDSEQQGQAAAAAAAAAAAQRGGSSTDTLRRAWQAPPETHVLGDDPNSLPPWSRPQELRAGEDPRRPPREVDRPCTSHIYARPDMGERMGPGHNYSDWLDELGVAAPDDSLGTSDFGPRFGSSAGDADSPTARRGGGGGGGGGGGPGPGPGAGATSMSATKRGPPPPLPASSMSQSPSWPDDERSRLSYQAGAPYPFSDGQAHPGHNSFNGYATQYGMPQGAEARIAQLESELIRQQDQYQSDVDSLRHALDESVQALATCASAIETMCADSLSTGSTVGGFPDERAISEWQKAAAALWEAASLGRAALTSSVAGRAVGPGHGQPMRAPTQPAPSPPPLSGRSNYAACAHTQRDRSVSPAPSAHSSCRGPQPHYPRQGNAQNPRETPNSSNHDKAGAQAGVNGCNGYSHSTYSYSQPPPPSASSAWPPQHQHQSQPHAFPAQQQHHQQAPPHLNSSCLASPGPGQSQPHMAPAAPAYPAQPPSPWSGASYGDATAMGHSLHCLQPGHLPPGTPPVPPHPHSHPHPYPLTPPHGHPYGQGPYPAAPPHPFALSVPPIMPPPTPFARPYIPGGPA